MTKVLILHAGRDKVTTMLLMNGANVNTTDKEVSFRCFQLIISSHRMSFETFCSLKGWSPLHLAAEKGNNRIVIALIKSGANVNAVDKEGWTALHLASRSDKDEIINLLLKNGANIQLKDSAGRTAFEDADEKGMNNLNITDDSIENNYKTIV